MRRMIGIAVMGWLVKQELEGHNYSCVLCNQNVEETVHLFFTCPFSQACWQHLGVQWNLVIDFFHMLLQVKQGFSHPFFMKVFIISAWQIWKQRNDFVFSGGQSSFLAWRTGFIEACLWAHRISENKHVPFFSWAELCTLVWSSLPQASCFICCCFPFLFYFCCTVGLFFFNKILTIGAFPYVFQVKN